MHKEQLIYFREQGIFNKSLFSRSGKVGNPPVLGTGDRRVGAGLLDQFIGLVAQSGERQPVTLEVVGSKPIKVAIVYWLVTQW
ncbi:hypothetical protein UFOVP447_127 [uncultured Caudovirales phage]|uniref:Uncharacterized protein n=1 Tax=uncultured Caudovirales phage TaxID=2100421 RepID=A0A6J5M9J2_9CAUD|nr:hypothetical protein UFOVP447_127 [uncultured Caudovirales phage]